MYYDQQPCEIRCEWGAGGISALAPETDVFVIVDVLSFCTCVDIAVGNGAVVLPFRWRDASAAAYAEQQDAIAASHERRFEGEYSLSPASLLAIGAGERLVLPSPNGSTLSLATGAAKTFAGCLRNARAVAVAAQELGRRISLIPAGERWPDGSLRPAIEDLIGAGAIAHELPGTRSPETMIAEAAFLRYRDLMPTLLHTCSSGRELIERGFARDVELAAALNASSYAPLFDGRAYGPYAGTRRDANRSESCSAG